MSTYVTRKPGKGRPWVPLACRAVQVNYGLGSWTVRGSNSGGGEIFRTRPDQPWDPPSLIYNGYRVSYPGVKRPGRGGDHPPPSSAEVLRLLYII